MFWLLLFLFVGTTVVSALLQKRPKDVQPASTGDFTLPTATEGRPIPVAYGTVYNQAPNVVWWGNLSINAIKQKSGGFLGIGAKKVTTGYTYFMGMQMMLSHGVIDEFVGLRIGDKDIPFTHTVASDGHLVCVVNQNTIFGGQTGEGGITGTFDFYYGSLTQDANAYLATTSYGEAPAYRGMSHVVARHMYVGTTQYIKNWAFIVRRCPNGLGLTSGHENIAGDANPACMIYDLMTSTRYGLGKPSSVFDLASFTAVATTLFNETMGLSMLIDSQSAADQVISEICRHCDLVLYTDPSTGLWTLKAIRADYDPATVPLFTEDDILEPPEISRPSFPDLLNQIMIEYTDRTKLFQKRIVPAYDLATYSQQGVPLGDTISFLALSNATAAQTVAMRELKTHSYPLAQVALKLNRKAWALRPGMPFKINWSPDGITGMVMRVAQINYGALDDTQLVITVTAVEDIFSVSGTGYAPPPDSGWIDPTSDPQPVATEWLEEAPYHLVDAARYMIDMAARADSISLHAEIWENDFASGFTLKNTLDNFTPTGLLLAEYRENTSAIDSTGFVVTGGIDLNLLTSLADPTNGLVRGDNLAVITDYFPDFSSGRFGNLLAEDEIIAWSTVVDNGDGTFSIGGVKRGVMDTIPRTHRAGSRVWFLSDGSATTETDPFSVEMGTSAPFPSVRNQPATLRATLDPSLAVPHDFMTQSRALRPYTPGALTLTGSNSSGLYHNVPGLTARGISGDVALNWAHRNRIQQKTQTNLTAQDAASDTSGAEGTYRVRAIVGFCKTLMLEHPRQLGRFPLVDPLTGKLLTIVGVSTAGPTPSPQGLVRAGYFLNMNAIGVVRIPEYQWWPVAVTGRYFVGIDLTTGLMTQSASMPSPPSTMLALWQVDVGTFTGLNANVNLTDLRTEAVASDTSAIVGATATVTLASLVAVGASGLVPFHLEVRQNAAALDSRTHETQDQWIAGYGYNYGMMYGGEAL